MEPGLYLRGDERLRFAEVIRSREADTSVADPGVGLAEAIDAVRAELMAAQQASRSQALRFSVGKVVVELGGELKHTGGAGTGVKFWVVNVDAKGERSSSATHKVSVELIPTDSSFEVTDSTASGPTPR